MKTNRRASNRNATKCGIFANILLSGEVMGESTEDYLALLAGLRKTYRPTNPLSEVLVVKLAFLYLRLSRMYKSDISTAPLLFTKVKEALEKDEPTVDTEYVGQHKEYRVVVFPRGPSPELLIRYEANIERQIARTLEQLERAQQLGQSAPESAAEFQAHMRSERQRKARANSPPKCDDFFTEISGVDDRLRDLRERAKTGVDMLSAARSIAALQVDLIASSLGLLRHVDEISFLLLGEVCPLQERIRRLRLLIRMNARIQGTILRAFDLYILCLGGKEAIAIQATAEWIRGQRARAPVEAGQLEIDQILKIMIKKSGK